MRGDLRGKTSVPLGTVELSHVFLCCAINIPSMGSVFCGENVDVFKKAESFFNGYNRGETRLHDKE